MTNKTMILLADLAWASIVWASIVWATPVLAGGPDAKLATGPAGTYARTCGYCHGVNIGPVLLGKQYAADAIALMVRSGNGGMPAFRPTEITDADLKALAVWIEASSATATDRGQ